MKKYLGDAMLFNVKTPLKFNVYAYLFRCISFSITILHMMFLNFFKI